MGLRREISLVVFDDVDERGRDDSSHSSRGRMETALQGWYVLEHGNYSLTKYIYFFKY